MEMLRSVNLDKIFHRGSGDHLYYFDDDGSEVEVLDCLGGYGATFFGHNNQRLKMKISHSGMNSATAENFMRSAKAPTISAGVIAAKVIWKQM